MKGIITEKHNTAKRIADILGGSGVQHRKLHNVDVYEFDDTVVMGLTGHVIGLDFSKEYNDWSRTDVRELINADIERVPTRKTTIKALQGVAKKVDHVTIATDYDREGELIGVEALNVMMQANPNLTSDRMHYSAITPSEIKNAYSNHALVNYNLAAAAEARQIIDLIWGATLTRFISLSAGRLGKNFLSVGRVQSPTLSLIVDRERDISAFVPEKYWTVQAVAHHTNGDFTVKHAGGRFKDKANAESIVKGASSEGVITDLNANERQDSPPAPFNTTEFLSAASGIGYSTANAMRIAEQLYLGGFISYPRTDNTVYPNSLNLREQLIMFKDSDFGVYVSRLLDRDVITASRGKRETSDHPPIYPVSVASKASLNRDQWVMYDLVVRRFLATLSEPAVWSTTKVKLEVSGEVFKASGLKLIVEGWRGPYFYHSPKDKELPDMNVGDSTRISDIEICDGETQPPPRYGQGKLIKMMERLELGTKSTRHEIISKLYARGYVYSSPLKPTNKATSVIESLESYAPMIAKPDMTQHLEEDMSKIADGIIKEGSVISESREMLGEVFKDLTNNKERITESLQNGLREDRIVGVCPECKGELIVRRSRKGSRFIGCSSYPECNFSLPLPKTGNIVVTEKECEEHNMRHLQILTKGRRPWMLGCPHCNYIEWKNKSESDLSATDGKSEGAK